MIDLNLPEEFLQRMKTDLKNEYESFVKSYENPPYIALRVNTLKTSVEEFKGIVDFCGGSVEWCEEGFYYDGKKGSHPSSIAGLFYSQEPSAQISAELCDIKKGDKVLDLCSAPGGKSTQAAAKLCGAGLLVSNEPILSRAKILKENIVRMGIKNAVVTNMYPDKMEKHFEGFFDKIIVDAPCSGEGMFRKDETAVREWSIEHTISCAQRQSLILDSAYKMLKCGGTLVYSTCTFSREENEMMAENFTKKYPDISLLQMHRLMPHKIKGEGHFSAVFKKSGNESDTKRAPIKTADKSSIDIYREFEKENLNTYLSGDIISFGDVLYLAPEHIGSLDSLKCILCGLELGEVRKGRFIPAHHLCMSLKKEDFKRTISLNEGEIRRYLCGESIVTEAEKGFGAMLYENKFPIGWYKYSENLAKNHYPKYLRG